MGRMGNFFKGQTVGLAVVDRGLSYYELLDMYNHSMDR